MSQLGYKTIRRIMKNVTKKPVSSRAIHEMLSTIESLIKHSTALADNLLCEENKARVVQNLRENKRLSEEYIKMAFERILNKDREDT